MMRLTYAKRNIFYKFVPNICATVSLAPHSGTQKRGGNKMAGQKTEAQYLGVAEAEARTGVSRWTWRRWAYDGKIASVKLGKRLLIPTSEIQRLIDRGTMPALEGRD